MYYTITIKYLLSNYILNFHHFKKRKTMSTLDEILLATRSCYKKSVMNGYEELEDDLLSVITMIDRLKDEKVVAKTDLVTRENIDESKYRDLAYVAYVLSEYGHREFYENLTQTQVLEKLAQILKTKPATLRNVRDFLDSYTSSSRQGWKKPLSDRLQRVYNECSELIPRDKVIEKAKSILEKYRREV